MSASVLDRASTALVVVDIQERLALAMAHRERVIARTILLIRAAAIVGVPIVVTRQYPKGLGDLEPAITDALKEVEDAGASVLRADKVDFNCFAEPAFAEVLADLGRSQVLLAGMETHICICQTALAGLRLGHDVHVAADACCSREDANHGTTLARLGTAGIVTSTAESAAYELVGRAGTPEFKELLAAVKG